LDSKLLYKIPANGRGLERVKGEKPVRTNDRIPDREKNLFGAPVPGKTNCLTTEKIKVGHRGSMGKNSRHPRKQKHENVATDPKTVVLSAFQTTAELTRHKILHRSSCRDLDMGGMEGSKWRPSLKAHSLFLQNKRGGSS